MSRPGWCRQPVASSRPQESPSTNGTRGYGQSPRGGSARGYYPRRGDLLVGGGSCVPPKSAAASHDGCSLLLVSPVLSPAWSSVSSPLLERAKMSKDTSPSSTST